MIRTARKTAAPDRGGPASHELAHTVTTLPGYVIPGARARQPWLGTPPSQIMTAKVADFLDEAGPRRIAFQDDVIAAFERHETRAGDGGGEPAALVEGMHGVVSAIQYQRRDLYLSQQIAHVDLIDGLADPHRVFRRRGDALQVIEPLHLLGAAPWDEKR